MLAAGDAETQANGQGLLAELLLEAAQTPTCLDSAQTCQHLTDAFIAGGADASRTALTTLLGVMKDSNEPGLVKVTAVRILDMLMGGRGGGDAMSQPSAELMQTQVVTQIKFFSQVAKLSREHDAQKRRHVYFGVNATTTEVTHFLTAVCELLDKWGRHFDSDKHKKSNLYAFTKVRRQLQRDGVQLPTSPSMYQMLGRGGGPGTAGPQQPDAAGAGAAAWSSGPEAQAPQAAPGAFSKYPELDEALLNSMLAEAESCVQQHGVSDMKSADALARCESELQKWQRAAEQALEAGVFADFEALSEVSHRAGRKLLSVHEAKLDRKPSPPSPPRAAGGEKESKKSGGGQASAGCAASQAPAAPCLSPVETAGPESPSRKSKGRQGRSAGKRSRGGSGSGAALDAGEAEGPMSPPTPGGFDVGPCSFFGGAAAPWPTDPACCDQTPSFASGEVWAASLGSPAVAPPPGVGGDFATCGGCGPGGCGAVADTPVFGSSATAAASGAHFGVFPSQTNSWCGSPGPFGGGGCGVSGAELASASPARLVAPPPPPSHPGSRQQRLRQQQRLQQQQQQQQPAPIDEEGSPSHCGAPDVGRCAQLEAQVQILQANNLAYQEQIAAVQEEKNAAWRRLEQLEPHQGELKDLRAALADLTEANSQLQRELDQQRHELYASRQQVRGLEEQLSEANEMLTQTRRRLFEEGRKKTQLEDEIREHGVAAGEFRDTLAAEKVRHAETEFELLSMRRVFDTTRVLRTASAQPADVTVEQRRRTSVRYGTAAQEQQHDGPKSAGAYAALVGDNPAQVNVHDELAFSSHTLEGVDVGALGIPSSLAASGGLSAAELELAEHSTSAQAWANTPRVPGPAGALICRRPRAPQQCVLRTSANFRNLFMRSTGPLYEDATVAVEFAHLGTSHDCCEFGLTVFNKEAQLVHQVRIQAVEPPASSPVRLSFEGGATEAGATGLQAQGSFSRRGSLEVLSPFEVMPQAEVSYLLNDNSSCTACFRLPLSVASFLSPAPLPGSRFSELWNAPECVNAEVCFVCAARPAFFEAGGHFLFAKCLELGGRLCQPPGVECPARCYALAGSYAAGGSSLELLARAELGNPRGDKVGCRVTVRSASYLLNRGLAQVLLEVLGLHESGPAVAA